jgi:hypothetical protein
MMNEKQASAFRDIMKEIENSPHEESVDYKHMTPPCGLPCFACGFYMATKHEKLQAMISEVYGIPLELAVCKGCRDEGGECGHLPMPCRLYPCAQEKGIEFCHECSDFPCDYLHPYADKADLVWHNTKVFNLCLMKKMGLEAWAKDKARSVREVYYWENWTL